MQCPLQSADSSAVLLDYCSQKSSPATTLLVKEHIGECSRCLAFVEAQASVWTALDSWEDAPISPDFNRRLYARIDELESGGWWKRAWKSSWTESLLTPFGWRPAMPIATVCLTLAAAFMLYTPAPQAPHEEKMVAPMVKESVDLEQIQRTLDDMEMLNQLSAPSAGRNTTM